MSDWELHMRCPCGRRHLNVPFNDVGFISDQVCGGCGSSPSTWETVIERRAWRGVWWKPWTWLSWCWVEKTDLDEHEEVNHGMG